MEMSMLQYMMGYPKRIGLRMSISGRGVENINYKMKEHLLRVFSHVRRAWSELATR